MSALLRTLGRTAGTGLPAAAASSAASCSAIAPISQSPLRSATFPCAAALAALRPATSSACYASTSGGSGTSSSRAGGVGVSTTVGPADMLAASLGPAPVRGSGGLRLRARAPHRQSGNGQVGPPPHRKGAGGKAGDKASGGVAVAPPSAPSAAVAEVLAGGDDDLEELDEEAGQQLAPYMDAVVKVYCMHTEPNYSLPWQRKRQYSSSSSGFVVAHGGRNWLLTNAHSVDYHTQVKVKRRGDDRKFLARVLSVGVDCDIAALEVDDPDFWAPQTPGGPPPPVLELGPLPRLQDGVAVVGYPIGGDTISVTAGVVSRIEVTDYSHGSTDLLAIQIDAAINGGNSGGPVFNRACTCVGIAFQALVGSDVENVGYVIPTPVVAHFLDDYMRTGGFNGFPQLGVQWQRMESDALRRAYGMAAGQKGVLVRGVNPTAAAAGLLRPDDVLLGFDGTAISNDGTVPFRTGERIAFSYLVTNKFVGDSAKLDVLRAGERIELEVKLSKPTALVPPHLSNRDPPYLIVGGLVFTPASEPYLQSEYGAEYGSDAPVKILDRLYHGFPGQAGEEVVVLSQVLACDATLGYEEVYNVQLLRFNGTQVSNLQHLAQLVAAAMEAEKGGAEAVPAGAVAGTVAAGGGFLRFDLEYNEVVVVEAKDVLEVTPAVMRSHSIPHDMSADLRAALAAGTAHNDVAAAAAAGTSIDGGKA